MPSGTLVGGEVDARSAIDGGDRPRHRHGARIGRIVGDEVDRLDDPCTGNELDEARLDDVGVAVAFPQRARRVWRR